MTKMSYPFRPPFKFPVVFIRVVLLGFALIVGWAPQIQTSACHGQTSADTATERQDSQPKLSNEQLRKNFDVAIEELRGTLKKIKRSGLEYYQDTSTAAHKHREEWEADADAAEKAFAKVRKTAFEYFLTVETPSEEVIKIIQRLNKGLIERGELTVCYEATKKLSRLRPGDPELAKLMGRISILTNDFEAAAAYAQGNAAEIKNFPMPERALYNFVDDYQAKFRRELELREQDATADDLPHAIIETTKGQIVIELFENQAPETVANFVSLVETGFYDRIIFHRVLKNIMAHTGSMSMNRRQPVGYTIYDEAQRPDARHHFRGSVSMQLVNGEPNSAGAEFVIMLVPGPNMDGRHTVFGRVISDMRVLDSIQETFKINEEGQEELLDERLIPDMIKSITVTRLRDHEYEPNRVKEEEDD